MNTMILIAALIAVAVLHIFAAAHITDADSMESVSKPPKWAVMVWTPAVAVIQFAVNVLDTVKSLFLK